MLLRPRASMAVIVAALLASTACQSKWLSGSRESASSVSLASDGAPAPYPHGAWRILSWGERDRIVIWVSHILISHRSAHREPSLRPAGWAPDTFHERSRAEAFTLAKHLAEQAASHPETFDALAREHSDDEVTRMAGGSLGGVRATQLPRVFVDALTALRPGEVSRPIETGLGFHVLLRRSPPPPEEVEGQRVVIRYAGTLSSVDESESQRDRQDALALAKRVANQAREDKVPFASLVRQFSEHADKELQGDIGVWSTAAPGDKPREIEVLSHLGMDQIAAPIDSIWGFQVLRRVEASHHERSAMASIRFKFGPTLPPEDPRSRESMYTAAKLLARRLHEDPSAFADANTEHQDATVEVGEWGHGPSQVTLALARLHFGEVAPEPVAIPFFFVVPMKLDPALIGNTVPPPSYELPLRARPDLRRLFRDADSAALAARVVEFVRPEVEQELGLAPEDRMAFGSVLAALKQDLQQADTGEARVRGYEVAVRRLHESMSEAVYSRLMVFFEQEAARIVLAEP